MEHVGERWQSWGVADAIFGWVQIYFDEKTELLKHQIETLSHYLNSTKKKKKRVCNLFSVVSPGREGTSVVIHTESSLEGGLC